MNEIDLRRFDLNLLIVFEVLMTERSVSRAAERLGRTQSAVSHSLSRLRSQLGDPLLIKGGVRMQPTAVALDLIEQTRPMLRESSACFRRATSSILPVRRRCSASRRLISCSPCLHICCRVCAARRPAYPPNGPRRASRPCWTLRRGRSMWRSCPPNFVSTRGNPESRDSRCALPHLAHASRAPE